MSGAKHTMEARSRHLAKAILKSLIGIFVSVLLVPWLVLLVERWEDLTSDGPAFPGLRRRVAQYVTDLPLPSIAVAAARDGNIVWEESFGWADVERQVKATPHTLYAMASTSKAFTATGVMVLVERGQIDLDRPVGYYLDDLGLRAFEGDLSDVTLRRIFTHTSGLPRYWSHHHESELGQRPGVRELVRRYGILVSPPGERYIYSNVGIGMARLVIEEISGRDYAAFMRSEVFDPLGLTHTAVVKEPYQDEGIAQKYIRGEKQPFLDMGFRAAGSVWASAHDLVSFGMFHLKDHLPHQRPILSDETIDAMYQSVDPRLPHHNYHLPWIEYRHRGYKVMEFGGHVMGGKVSFRLVPSEDIAVVVLSNGEEADTQKISNWILNRLLPGFNRIGILKRIASRFRNVGSGTSNGSRAFEGQWVGQIITYEGSMPIRLTIDAQGGARLDCEDTRGMTDRSELSASARTLRMAGNSLHATFPVRLPTTDASRTDHDARFDLRLHGDRLTGPVYAESREFLFYLPSYAQLTRIRPAPDG